MPPFYASNAIYTFDKIGSAESSQIRRNAWVHKSKLLQCFQSFFNWSAPGWLYYSYLI